MANDEQGVVEVIARDEGTAIVEIPADKTAAVLQYLASLDHDDTDVSGYMISRGGFGGFSAGTLAATQPTESACHTTSIGPETDFRCTDTDTLTTP